MTEYYAHSSKDGFPAQTYQQHIKGVVENVRRFAHEAAIFSVNDGNLLIDSSVIGAAYHDLGKLDQKNQLVLSGKETANILPVNHADAGAAFLMSESINQLLSAVAVYAHHKGLPDFVRERIRGESMFRNSKIKDLVDASLTKYAQTHEKLIGKAPLPEVSFPKGGFSVFLRILLSCLVDADHTNTASHFGQYPTQTPIVELNPRKRLNQLDNYVAKLGTQDTERSKLRKILYEDCRNAIISENISSCDSPVGSGKTTSVMAHLLAQAARRGLRRIFVILPFTNIIQQSVKVYRKALVLPGENPEDVVAELHHRADFESKDLRHLTALWRAPIIVTTAVTFFETIASNVPSTLRRLHELPGSAIFVDEAHAALPASLLPVAWRWINSFADDWSCYWVLASGSLNRFWEIDEISSSSRNVPSIVSEPIREALSGFEIERVEYKSTLTPKNVDELIDWMQKYPGPRLLIVNTVQSAAVIANYLRNVLGRDCVEHLSTALLPKDRDKTLERVKKRLESPTDTNWTLVATSCVEAGVDLSFRIGFRELASLTSLLQAAGRINRNGEYGVAEMHTFRLIENAMLRANPGLKNAASILQDFIEKGYSIEPSLTTEAIEREIKIYGSKPMSERLVENEEKRNFQFVNDNFTVIEKNTCTTVVDKFIASRIQSGQIDWQDLQRNSVQIGYSKLQKLHIPHILDEIYYWNLSYDDFLGYMAGIIDVAKFESENYVF